MDISFFDREIFTSPTTVVDNVSVNRCAANQVVEENRKKGGEVLWENGWFLAYPFPFIVPET